MYEPWIKHTKEMVTNVLSFCTRTILLAWQIVPGWTLISASLIVLQGLLPLAYLYLIKLIVDFVTINVNSINQEAVTEHILFLIFLAAGVVFLTVLCDIASSYVSSVRSLTVSDHILDMLHTKSTEVDLEYYENPKYYDTLYRAQYDTPFRPAQIIDNLARTCQSIISLLGLFWLIASFSWLVAIALTVSAISSGIIQLIYSNRIYNWRIASTPRERKGWYAHWLLTNDSAAKEIRLFNIGPLFVKKYHDIRRELRNEFSSIILKQSVAELATQTISVVVIFGSFILLIQKTLQGNITLGDMVMFIGVLQQGNLLLSAFLNGFKELYENSLYMSTLFEFLDIKTILKEPQNPLPVPKVVEKGISFENVGFCYPGQEKKVLSDINLCINPGQIIALVGENGSGKTTLVKLLCRFYDPTEGQIRLEGANLCDISILDLRKEISVVFQDYIHYNLTARENIWLSSINKPIDTEDVLQAAEFSGANFVIDRLENGYETILGKWFEDGAEISIGEWQKIALSRAFFRDSHIIILDEPTSSLDPKAEDEVFRKFKQLTKGKTAIMISHRLSTVKTADCIYFLKNGKILESGNHEVLMTLGGEYAKLFKIQSQHYN